MGCGYSSTKNPYPNRDLTKWRLEHVVALHTVWPTPSLPPSRPSLSRARRAPSLAQCYIEGNYEFALDRTTIKEIFKTVVPTATDIIDDVIWPRFDATGDAPLLNALEVFAGLVVVVQGSLDEKVALLLQIFDLNGAGSLSHDELVVLMYTTLTSTVLLTHRGTLPEDAQCEALADEAFWKTANDVAGRAAVGPLATWAAQRLERLGADAVAAQRAALFEAQRLEKNAAISKATAGLRGTDESEEEIRAKAAAAAAAAPPPRDGYTPKDPEQLLHVFGLLPEYAWPEIADGFTSDGWRPVPGQHDTGYGTLPATGKAKGAPAM